MPKLSRKTRSWLAAAGTVWIPWATSATGLTGFWAVFAVCAALVLWTCWWFRFELMHLTTEVPPNERNQSAYWLLLPGLAMLFFALYPFVRLYRTEQVEPLGFEDLLQTYIHDRSLYVSDLARTGLVVHDKVFENVTFVGPAVVTLMGGTVLEKSDIEANASTMDGVFLEVKPGALDIGAIGFRDCTFKNVTFKQVQFAGTYDQKVQFFNGIDQVNNRMVTPMDRQQAISAP
jgi:hypothetical protein